MIKTITRDDIIRYVYHETTDQENETIESSMLCDAELREFHSSIVQTARSVQKAKLKPSDGVIERILNYSKNHNLQSIDH